MHTVGIHTKLLFCQGTACDLITGEERKYVDPDGEPSGHVACTVEMTNVKTVCESIYIKM